MNSYLRAACRTIRRAASLMDWTFGLLKLQKAGISDPSQIIRRWNSEYAVGSRTLGGKKASALRNLLAFPQEALDSIQVHVSRRTWEGCVFTEEALSSRKLSTSYVHKKAGDSQWTSLGRNSPDSIALLFEMLVNEAEDQYDKGVRHLRKIDKLALESRCEEAAFVVNISAELVTFGLAHDVVQKEFVQLWVVGDAGLQSAVSNACIEKASSFHLRDIGQLRLLLDQHAKPVPDKETSASELHSQMNNLELSAWKLFCDQLEYDARAVGVYHSTLSHYMASVDQQKREWRLKLHNSDMEHFLLQLCKRGCASSGYSDPSACETIVALVS